MADNLPAEGLRKITATLNGRPILELCTRIIIAEDMTSVFPRCSIVVSRDPRFEMQEMLAGQPVKINIQPSQGPELKIDHIVHSAKPNVHKGGKGLSGVIDTVCPDFQNVLQNRVKKSWTKKNVDAIIKEIHEEFSSYPIEVTKGFKQTSMNGMSLLPLQTITKAGQLSGAGSKGFYFQTNEQSGKAKFLTLEDMASKKPKMKFTYNTAASADASTIFSQTFIYDIEYQGSSVSTLKETKAQSKSYVPSFVKTGKTDQSGSGSTIPGLGVKATPSVSSFPILNTIEQDKEKRMVDTDQQGLNDYTSKLKILVNICTQLHVGDVIEVESGSATYFSDANPKNAVSGKWLITAIMHSIEPGGGPSGINLGRTLIHCIGKIE